MNIAKYDEILNTEVNEIRYTICDILFFRL
jgi:hypothetical protein